MILISNYVARLVSGYDKILAAESGLKRKWRAPLLAAYARRRQAYEAALVDYNQRLAGFKKRLRLAIFLASLLVGLGALACPLQLYISEVGNLRGVLLCFAPLLVLAGLVGWASVGMLWLFWRNNYPRPKPPPHPNSTDLFKPLLPSWRDGLRGGLPAEKAYEGANGEHELVTRLQRLSSQDYVLYRLRQQPGNDVDVTVVGAKGVWVFEVKYLRGEISYRNGEWRHQKHYYLPGGRPTMEEKSTGEPFDQQWRRMADDVTETLRRHAPSLTRRLPPVLKVRGGLVFTHPNASYDIPSGSPFNWGVVDFWLGQLVATPEMPGMNERLALQVIEVLLSRHWRVSGEKPRRSMEAYADRLIAHAEQRLQAWYEA